MTNFDPEREVRVRQALAVKNTFLNTLEDQHDKILTKLLTEYRRSEVDQGKLIGIIGELAHNDSLIRSLDRDIREAEHG